MCIGNLGRCGGTCQTGLLLDYLCNERIVVRLNWLRSVAKHKNKVTLKFEFIPLHRGTDRNCLSSKVKYNYQILIDH